MTNNKEVVVSGFRNELSESLKRHGKQVINECLIVVNKHAISYAQNATEMIFNQIIASINN